MLGTKFRRRSDGRNSGDSPVVSGHVAPVNLLPSTARAPSPQRRGRAEDPASFRDAALSQRVGAALVALRDIAPAS